MQSQGLLRTKSFWGLLVALTPAIETALAAAGVPLPAVLLTTVAKHIVSVAGGILGIYGIWTRKTIIKGLIKKAS